MRNLINYKNSAAEDPVFTNISKCQIVTNIASKDRHSEIYIVTEGIDPDIYLVAPDYSGVLEPEKIISFASFKSSLSKSQVEVVGIRRIFDNIYVALADGTFIIFFGNPIGEWLTLDAQVEDIAYISWSDDFEKVITISSTMKLTLLNINDSESEKLKEFSLLDFDDETNELINVGWGKKETQFRGSEGKFSAENEEKVNLTNSSDDTICITWKKNSSAFAVSYMCPKEGFRKVKIFDQNGTLNNITKDVYGLEAVLEWCPSRNVISCSQTLPNKKVICFLEQNGLRHGEFELCGDTADIKKLYWNMNGSILATQCENSIYLWTTSNYKWYIKNKLQYDQSIAYVQWDDVVSNRLHVILTSGIYRTYEWTPGVVESCEIKAKSDFRNIALINGRTVSFTPYGKVFRPPSLPSKSLSFPCYVNAVIFQSESNNCKYETLFYFSDNTLLPFSESADNDVNNRYEFRFHHNEKKFKFNTSLQISGWIWLEDDLYFAWTRLDGHYFCAAHLCHQSRTCIIKTAFRLDFPIISTTSYRKGIFMVDDASSVLLYKDDKLGYSSIPSFIDIRFRLVRIVMINSCTLLGFSKTHDISVNENIKCRNVKDFYWHPPFLVILTKSNRLQMFKLESSRNPVEFQLILDRRVESKSHLISVIGDHVLLEMDRGNIEVIKPRPFVLNKMTQLLSNQLYADVFKLLRKQRINLNVLFDHDSTNFTNQIDQIIRRVPDPLYLTLFALELENSNVAQSMFPWKYQKVDEEFSKNKIKFVSTALHDAIISQLESNPALIQPLISVLVKLNKLASAAKYAIDQKQVTFLFQLVDSKAVYEAVLASYDLNYALKIAESSKMDPGDYLPFIKSLQNTSDSYKKFSINDFLGRHSKALKCLADCEEQVYFEECLKYIEKYNLYKEAYRIFARKFQFVCKNIGDGQNHSKDISRYFKITVTCAEYYYSQKNYDKAAVLFEKARIFDKAIECYTVINAWHSAVSLIKHIGASQSDSMESYLKLRDSLAAKRHFEEAGWISLTLLKDYTTATEHYLLGRCYNEALDAAIALGGYTTAYSIVKPKLIEDAQCYREDFKSIKNSVEQYVQQLNTFKEKEKIELEKATEEDEDDKLSTCGSVSSSSSSFSECSSSSKHSNITATSSAKRARRLERKLWNLKPGNPREKPSLMNAIQETIRNFSKNYSNKAPELIRALEKLDEFEETEKLKTEYESVLKYFQEVCSSVWSNDELTEGGFKDIAIKISPNYPTFVHSLPDVL